MPYENQLMAYRSIHKLVNNKRVKDTLSEWEIKEVTEEDKKKISFENIKPSDWTPTYIIAIDGSKQEEIVRNGFPMSEVAYITIASAMLDMEKLNSHKQQRPLEPKKFREIETSQSIEMVFPGANVIKKTCKSPEETLREIIYTTLKDSRIMDGGETLLETYEELLKYRLSENTKKPKCPYPDCQKKLLNNDIQELDTNFGEYSCSCDLKLRLFSTDMMRLHEEMNPVSTNESMFSLIMQAIERLYLINILRSIEAKGWISSLGRFGFIIDGSLSVFSRASWLSNAISKELLRINKIVREKTSKDLLMIGIEKTGSFVEHFDSLDKSHTHFRENKSGEIKEYQGLANHTVKLLSNEYIKNNIVYSNSTKPYGEGTYFGRKFFYKSKNGSLIVATVPFLEEEHKNLNDIDIKNFPRIHDILNTIDKITSSMYPNSLMPIISAHNEATIPLNIGQKVLEKIAKEAMNLS